MQAHVPQQAQTHLHTLALKADALVMAVLLLGAAAAMALGMFYGPIVSGSTLAVVIAGIALLVWRLAPGTLWSRLTFAVCGMLMVGLHTQLSMGLTEMHFGVFVFLAFLLVYRDWRPIVAAAATIAVHHIATDRLQALGWPVFCMTEPNFGRVLIHASFVVVQTGVEVLMARKMRADAIESAELQALCRPANNGQLDLNVAHLPTSSTTATAVKAAFVQLDAIVRQANQTATSVREGVSDIASSNENIALRTDSTASQLQEAAACMQGIREVAAQSADAASQARSLAHHASVSARSCGDLVNQVVHTMEAIHSSSNKIGDIVTLIDSIAFQTNILALNAAVEAASAGEHGRGFAVVAEEVRALAQRSAAAARDVRVLIQSSLAQAAQGSQLVEQAGSSMHTVVEHAGQVEALIESLSQLAQKQATDLHQTAGSIEMLDTMTQENARLVEQSSNSAAQLLQQATRLQSEVSGVCTSSQTSFTSVEPVALTPSLNLVDPPSKPPAVHAMGLPGLRPATG